MKVTTIKSKMLGGLDAVKGALAGKDALNPFRLMKVESFGSDSVILTAVNDSMQITSRVFCELDGEGVAVFDGRRLMALVGALEEGVMTFAFDGATAKISGGAARYSLASGDLETFATMAALDDSDVATCSLKAGMLAEALRKTSYSACQEAHRAAICGVHFELNPEKGIEVVATDGRSLSHVSLNREVEGVAKEMTVSNAVVKELTRLLAKRTEDDEQLLVKTDGKIMVVTAGLWNLTAKLIDMKYPMWRPIAGQTYTDVSGFDRVAFLGELRRAGVASGGEDNAVKLTFQQDCIAFSAKDEFLSAESSIAAKYSGEKVSLNFNSLLLSRVLDNIDDDKVSFGVSPGKTAPLVIEVDGLPFRAVVMPLRLR
jgi:DNA polymerase III sliding clamp (beta) subunit (PCNA family)